jgi:DNA-binding NarL/FixJ family response regulator
MSQGPFHHRASPADRADGARAPVATRPRLGIADDDLVIQTLLSASLEHAFEVVGVAGDSEAAITLAQEQQPDAMLVDVEMPGGGGTRAVAGIVEVAPHAAIVVLSADQSDTVVRELLEAGAVAYCRKGIDTDELAGLLLGSIATRTKELAFPPSQASPGSTA